MVCLDMVRNGALINEGQGKKVNSYAAESIERILDQEIDQNEKHSVLFKVK